MTGVQTCALPICVPQGQHVLLNNGLQALAQCFPGFLADLQQDGVERLAWSEQMRWFQHGSWKTRAPSGLDFYPQGRPALEARIRARVRQIAGVALMGGCRVQGLLFSADAQRVRGLSFETEGQTQSCWPTWWWTPVVVARACWAGWRPRAMRRRPRNRR